MRDAGGCNRTLWNECVTLAVVTARSAREMGGVRA